MSRRWLFALAIAAIVGWSFTGVACIAKTGARRGDATAGNAAAETADGLTRAEIIHQGVTRTYFVHRPAVAPSGRPMAAVFVFHGGMGDGPKIERMTGMVRAADRRGFIAVFPNGGRNGSEPWNDGRDTTAGDKDDVGFVHAIIDQLVTEMNVDPQRIFATGASNGGMFVYRLACDATGKFAAFAAVVANLPAGFAPRCSPSRPAPMLIINGTDDRLMPWAGGEIAHMRWLGVGRGGTVTSTPQTLAFWARANGCAHQPATAALPDRADDGTTVVRHQFSGCKNNATVMLYEIQGGGHTWPGNTIPSRTRASGVTSREIDATEVILGFFEQYGL